LEEDPGADTILHPAKPTARQEDRSKVLKNFIGFIEIPLFPMLMWWCITRLNTAF
jgi:hypothetical protein